MALQKQLIPLSFEQGLDTKRDRKQAVFGTFRRAENVVFETVGSFRKRYGYDNLPLLDSSSTAVTGFQNLAKFVDELLLLTSDALYAYSSALGIVTSKGSLHNVAATSLPIVNNSSSHDQSDVLYLEGLEVLVYRNSTTSEVRYSVRDYSTKTMLVADALVSASALKPRVAAIQNKVYILYLSGANVRYRRFNIFAPSTLESAQTMFMDANTGADANLDAVAANDYIVAAYNSTNVGSEIRAFRIDASGNNSSATGIAAIGTDALDVYVDPQSRVVVSYSDGTDVGYTVRTFGLGAELTAPTSLETIADVQSVSCVSTADGTYQFLYSVPGATNDLDYLKQNTGNLAAEVGTPSVVKRSISLASKIFTVDSTNYAVVMHDSTLQSTYFAMKTDGTLVAKFLPASGGTAVQGVLSKVEAIDDVTVLTSCQVKTKLETDNGTFFSLYGIQSTELDFEPPAATTAFLGNNLCASGGMVQIYDGASVAEAGFHLWPEGLSNTATSATGGVLDDGSYGYCAVYRWVDNYGQIHRSAPSPALTVVLSGGGSNEQATVRVPSLRLTAKSNVTIELYRTEDAGTLFYKLAESANTTSADYVDFADTATTDAQLISKELLYTTGGVLENTAPPSAKICINHGNRIALTGLENPWAVELSKLRAEGAPVEFNDTIRRQVDPVGGANSALASMDNTLIIFQPTACFAMVGDGPDNLGQNDNWNEPELLSADIGCSEPASIVRTPHGLMFKSQKGIYLLTTARTFAYIGKEVEAYNSSSITSAKVVPNLNQVRFTTSDNQCLVFNYQEQKWATFSNHEALAAEIIGNDYYYLRQDGSLFKQSTSFADNGVPVRMLAETGWISFAGLQGLQRVYKLLLLGEFKSAHQLRVQIAYDYNEAFTQEVVINTADFIDSTPYGGYSPYGDPSTVAYGGDGNVLQLRVDLKQQKCQAIKVRISDIQTTAGEGLALSAITFEVGGKGGLFKPSQAKVYGAQ